MTKDEIVGVFEKINFSINEYEESQIVALAGENCDHYRIVLSGCVSASMTEVDGKTVEVEPIKPGGSIAPAFLFSNPPVFVVDVRAKEKTKILKIDRKQFLVLLSADERILENYLQQISGKVVFLSKRIKFFSMKTIEQKLAGYLLELIKTMGNEVYLPMNITDLSRFFGVERPSLSRVLSEFKKFGIISGKGRTVKIIDEQKLKRVLIETG
jgi:CRP-like cAMP-binding protein